MTDLERSLTLRDGIALALGSIAGSGILFLPSLTYVMAGEDVLLIWLGAVLLCIPILFMFTDMVRAAPDSRGIEGLIARGLGPTVAATVPVLFLSLVILGIPGGALVVGDYAARALGDAEANIALLPIAVVVAALCINLAGVKTSKTITNLVTWTSMAIAVMLVVLTLPTVDTGASLRPRLEPGTVPAVLSGVVVAFWAFAGFENLTFIAGEFARPRRDFPIAMITALVAYGTLAVLLTAAIAGHVPLGQVDELSGLSQLARTISPAALSVTLVTVLAIALMQINAISWVWGMSRMVYAAAQQGELPTWFSTLDRRSVPRRALGLLAALFTVTTAYFLARPDHVSTGIAAASSVFVLLYGLSVIAYLRTTHSLPKRLMAVALLVALATTLAGSGFISLYAVGVFALALAIAGARERHASPGDDTAPDAVDAAGGSPGPRHARDATTRVE